MRPPPDKPKVLSKEDHARQMANLKELYKSLPKKTEDLFAYKLDWDLLFMHDIINKKCMPWIAQKITEYMGVEEMPMINAIVKLLNQKCTHSQLLNKIQNVLDDASQEFVEKLWRVLVFEDMKLSSGLFN